MMNEKISGLLKFNLFALLTLFSFTIQAQDISQDAAVIKAGEGLFNGNCKSCHRVKQELVGPALAGVTDRAPSIAWIKDWVRNSAKVVASGDKYAVALFDKYKKSQMTAFTSFTDDQIMSILAYVKAEADKPDAPPPGQQVAGNGAAQPGAPSGYLDAIMVGMIIILILMVAILGLITNALKKYLNDKKLNEEESDVVNNPYTMSSFVRSPGFIFLVIFVVGSITFKTVIDGLYSIGIQQGYQPKQPIAFSHKLHAGAYEINCVYCHTGVMKGKQANIPSPNICMNCHSQVKQESPEIQKIYAAIGYDVQTASYTGKQKPIEWVRIHNLPDLAYFNHSQHYNVGGIACQTCHGPIEQMDVVKQYAILTMGWCVDCHRKTDVNNAGNAYYDKLTELHNETKKGTKMKVEDIGGLECSKCHY
ncbi:MAG: c-type cytochrome [Bacteroidetes bacterium]|nr:c-type cytochrome [Bacteroidota bacterium]